MTRPSESLTLTENIAEATDVAQAANAVDDRRALLKKIGRFGLYTAPTLLIIFDSAKANPGFVSP